MNSKLSLVTSVHRCPSSRRRKCNLGRILQHIAVNHPQFHGQPPLDFLFCARRSLDRASSAHCTGGLLEIWSQNSTEWGGPPLISLHPEENKLVRFRGDATHRVLKHYSPSGQVRSQHLHSQPRLAVCSMHDHLFNISKLSRSLVLSAGES